jgi:hypothetical protein
MTDRALPVNRYGNIDISRGVPGGLVHVTRHHVTPICKRLRIPTARALVRWEHGSPVLEGIVIWADDWPRLEEEIEPPGNPEEISTEGGYLSLPYGKDGEECRKCAAEWRGRCERENVPCLVVRYHKPQVGKQKPLAAWVRLEMPRGQQLDGVGRREAVKMLRSHSLRLGMSSNDRAGQKDFWGENRNVFIVQHRAIDPRADVRLICAQLLDMARESTEDYSAPDAPGLHDNWTIRAPQRPKKDPVPFNIVRSKYREDWWHLLPGGHSVRFEVKGAVVVYHRIYCVGPLDWSSKKKDPRTCFGKILERTEDRVVFMPIRKPEALAMLEEWQAAEEPTS